MGRGHRGKRAGFAGRARSGSAPGSKRRPRARPVAAPKPLVESPVKDDGRFRVLIAVHRPRYRSRAERAVNAAGWEVRALLNREDPIGLLNQKHWHILILSDDFGRQKALALFHAAQRFRPKTRIVGVFEDGESAVSGIELCDAQFSPPWKTIEMRESVTGICEEQTGARPVFGVTGSIEEES